MRYFFVLLALLFFYSHQNCANTESLRFPGSGQSLQNESLRKALDAAAQFMSRNDYKEAFKQYLILTDPQIIFSEDDFLKVVNCFRAHAHYFLQCHLRSYASLVVWYIADQISQDSRLQSQHLGLPLIAIDAALQYTGHCRRFSFYEQHLDDSDAHDFIKEMHRYYGERFLENILGLYYPKLQERYYRLRYLHGFGVNRPSEFSHLRRLIEEEWQRMCNQRLFALQLLFE